MISRLPLIGYVLRLLNEERASELGLFVLNIFLLLALAILIFGYAALAVAMLVLTGVVLISLIAATFGR